MRVQSRLLAVLTVLVLASLACTAVIPSSAPVPMVVQTTPLPIATLAPVSAGSGSSSSATDDTALIALYQRVNRSVVTIQIQTADQQFALGSGIIYDTLGNIVTNHHVISDAATIEVDFVSGLKVHAKLVGSDMAADLAVIHVSDVPADQLIPLPIADSDQIQVGQRVIAIGSPFALSGSMSEGIISGLGRSRPSVASAPGGGTFTAPDTIQTDAAINPGNSGGPLLNLQGQVIGINESIDTLSGTNSGVSFAVASNTVRQIAPYLIKDGKFVYPYLGLTGLGELSLFSQEQLKLPQSTGVYVTSVVAKGPADQAGVQADSARTTDLQLRGDGDLIVAIDGRPVIVFSDILSYIINHARPGQAVTLTLLRNGKQMDVKVTLGERPSN
jgi:S1-C subfamily serine protease